MSDSVAGLLQLGFLIVLLAASYKPLGAYMAWAFTARKHHRAERATYKVLGVNADAEQRWPVYARAVIAFSALSVVLLYVLQRVQDKLPLSNDLPGVGQALAFNTAASFVSNTNWQSYVPEVTMGHLVQMSGLAVQNFVSAAVGIVVAIALVRGFARSRTEQLGNFWVDLVRCCYRILLPMAVLGTLILIAMGAVQNFSAGHEVTSVVGQAQTVPGGPLASQEVIKELGTNGGGFYNANSAHPFENPNPLSNIFTNYLLLVIPVCLTRTFGLMIKDKRQGYAILAVMATFWTVFAVLASTFEANGTSSTAAQAAGAAMEGKETRFGEWASALWAISTTGTSTGAVNASHDSMTPLGGGLALFHMMFGEVTPGGTGSGLYGMLVLVGASVGVLTEAGKAGIANPGIHGFSEILYAFSSASNNNGSAFAGLSANTPFYNTALGLAMLFGRYWLAVPVLAIAGSLARKKIVPVGSGTLPTHTPLFVGLLVGVVILVGALTFVPALALGPIVEHLTLIAAK